MEVLWETENERLIVEYDGRSDWLGDEYGCIIVCLPYINAGTYAGIVDGESNGECDDILNAAKIFAVRHGSVDAAEVLARWARIVYGAETEVFDSPAYGDDCTYVAIVTESIAQNWGCEHVPTPDTAEFRAYLEEGAYYAEIQEKVSEVVTRERTRCSDGKTETVTKTVDTWEETDSLVGFYGTNWKNNGVLYYFPAPEGATIHY